MNTPEPRPTPLTLWVGPTEEPEASCNACRLPVNPAVVDVQIRGTRLRLCEVHQIELAGLLLNAAGITPSGPPRPPEPDSRPERTANIMAENRQHILTPETGKIHIETALALITLSTGLRDAKDNRVERIEITPYPGEPPVVNESGWGSFRLMELRHGPPTRDSPPAAPLRQVEIAPGDGFRYWATFGLVKLTASGDDEPQILWTWGRAGSGPWATWYFRPIGYLSLGYYMEKMNLRIHPVIPGDTGLATAYCCLSALRGQEVGKAVDVLVESGVLPYPLAPQYLTYPWPVL